MSKRSDSPVHDDLNGSSLDLSDGSTASYLDSDNSRDVNLNSKKFTDYNLLETELDNKNDEDDKLYTTATEDDLNCERPEAREGKLVLNPENKSASEKATKISTPPTITSTPKLESEKSQPFWDFFPSSSDSNEIQTTACSKSALNQTITLSNEEIGKKFQDLSFAFKTDSMTIEKRLQLLKRKRDQAETNIENELRTIKDKLKTLQYLGLNSEFLDVMTELKKQLDFVLNATMELSGSAEGYGYAQHEEKWLELATVMLQHVENVESSKNDFLKASEKLKRENQRPSFLENTGDDDRLLRRRSLTAVALESNPRRRASIATVPRIGYSVLDTGSNGRGFQWTPTKPGGGATKKLSFSQASPRTLNGLPGVDDVRKDSSSSRSRKERRISETSMKNIDESPEPQQMSQEPELIEAIDPNNSNDVSDSSLHLKQLFESIEEIRRDSGTQERITAVYCLRRIVEWNKLLLSATRFRWPENVLHYVPFYITWYVVFILAFVFVGGLFTGINGCYTYSCLQYHAFWFAVPAFYRITRRYYRLLLPVFFKGVIALTLFFLLLLLLIKTLLLQLTNDEIDSLFKTLGLEIHYLNGPPPV